ncbi:MAG: class I SAM-dependent methyltransferase [Candidatus Babeliales bacterium]
MLKKFFITMLLFANFYAYCDDSQHYAIAVGEEDKDRLLVLNEIYNPESFQLLKQYVEKGKNVLELGCGLGICSQYMAKLVGEKGSVLATDINQEQIDLAQKMKASELKNLNFRKISALELEKLEQKFDVIYVRFLLMHLPNPEKILEQIKKVLSPNGKVIIEDVTGNYTLYSNPNTPAMEEVQRFDKLQFEIEKSDDCYFEQLPKLLVDYGFSIRLLTRAHPKLDTLHKRSMLSYNLSSLKSELIKANKITLKEYARVYPIVKEFEKREDVTVYSYELGQVVVQLR